MEIIVIQSEAFNLLLTTMEDRIKAAVRKALEEKNSSDQSDWLTIQDARKLLPFKSKTSWQKLRDHGEIEFSQFGRKIMYSRKSIISYLTKNKID
jgi:hypothetical protein